MRCRLSPTADVPSHTSGAGICQKQKFTTNSPYSLLRAIRPRGRSRHLAVLAQPVQGLMLTEAAQFEMADFNDRCRSFGGKSTSHEQWPANILAEEFQPAEDVMSR